MATKAKARLVADRFRRLWGVVQHITDNPGLHRLDLARHFNLSERQMQADLILIRIGIGLPLVRRNGYRFEDEGGSVRHSGLDFSDILTLARTIEASRRSGEAVDRLKQKLARLAPIHLRPLAEQLLVSPRRDLFLVLADAMLADETPRLRMHVKDSHTTWDKVVRPELILPYLGRWFVLGEDAATGTDRMFPFDDVISVEPAVVRIERKRVAS